MFKTVPDAELLDAALDLADLIVENTPLGTWMGKATLWSNLEIPSMEAAIDLEAHQILTFHTEDGQEQLRAWREKSATPATPIADGSLRGLTCRPSERSLPTILGSTSLSASRTEPPPVPHRRRPTASPWLPLPHTAGRHSTGRAIWAFPLAMTDSSLVASS